MLVRADGIVKNQYLAYSIPLSRITGLFILIGFGEIFNKKKEENIKMSLLNRRRIQWFFKGIINPNNFCEFQHYYYMKKFK